MAQRTDVTEVYVSKDVINVDKVMKNFHKNPELSMEELTRVMVENFQEVQLGQKNMEKSLNELNHLKAISNNTLGTWAAMGSQRKTKVVLKRIS